MLKKRFKILFTSPHIYYTWLAITYIQKDCSYNQYISLLSMNILVNLNFSIDYYIIYIYIGTTDYNTYWKTIF